MIVLFSPVEVCLLVLSIIRQFGVSVIFAVSFKFRCLFKLDVPVNHPLQRRHSTLARFSFCLMTSAALYYRSKMFQSNHWVFKDCFSDTFPFLRVSRIYYGYFEGAPSKPIQYRILLYIFRPGTTTGIFHYCALLSNVFSEFFLLYS